ncbi:MAG: YdcF family protein [Oligoflexia bacterium]|nr:YdcF family protein [Oligoflexia bacterium]
MFLIYFFTVTSPFPAYMYEKWITPTEGEMGQSVKVVPMEKIKHLQAAVLLSGDAIKKDLQTGQYIYGEAFRRFSEGLLLLQRGKVDYLIITKGNNNFDPNGILNEGDSFINWMKDVGVYEQNKNKILLISDVLNTFDEAQKATELMLKKGIKDFYIVTDIHHMKRAYLIYKKQSEVKGLIPVAYPVITYDSEGKGKMRGLWSNFSGWSLLNTRHLNAVLNEVIGVIAYRAKGYL